MLQYKEREVQLLSSNTPIKMSSFFNDLCVVDSLLIPSSLSIEVVRMALCMSGHCHRGVLLFHCQTY